VQERPPAEMLQPISDLIQKHCMRTIQSISCIHEDSNNKRAHIHTHACAHTCTLTRVHSLSHLVPLEQGLQQAAGALGGRIPQVDHVSLQQHTRGPARTWGSVGTAWKPPGAQRGRAVCGGRGSRGTEWAGLAGAASALGPLRAVPVAGTPPDLRRPPPHD
jgi:hypothetical protein